MGSSEVELEVEVPDLNYDEDLTEEFYGPEALIDRQYEEEELYDGEGYYDDLNASDGGVPPIVSDYTQLGAVPGSGNQTPLLGERDYVPGVSSPAPMATTSATSAVAPAEFASSSEEGGRVGAFGQSISPTGAAAAPPEPGMHLGREERAATLSGENPDGSPSG